MLTRELNYYTLLILSLYISVGLIWNFAGVHSISKIHMNFDTYKFHAELKFLWIEYHKVMNIRVRGLYFNWLNSLTQCLNGEKIVGGRICYKLEIHYDNDHIKQQHHKHKKLHEPSFALMGSTSLSINGSIKRGNSTSKLTESVYFLSWLKLPNNLSHCWNKCLNFELLSFIACLHQSQLTRALDHAGSRTVTWQPFGASTGCGHWVRDSAHEANQHYTIKHWLQ